MQAGVQFPLLILLSFHERISASRPAKHTVSFCFHRDRCRVAALRHKLHSLHRIRRKVCNLSAKPVTISDDESNILSKYGLGGEESLKVSILPGSLHARRRALCRSVACNVAQVAGIWLLSELTANRFRLMVNLTRWAVLTLCLAILRWYGGLMPSNSKWGHSGAVIDELGFVKERYQILRKDGTRSFASLRQVPGDGSCLFYSIAACLEGINGTGSSSLAQLSHQAAKLRQLAVDTLESGNDNLIISENDAISRTGLVSAVAAHFGMSPEDYCSNMRLASCWGGGCEAVALSNALKCQIYLYQVFCPPQTMVTAIPSYNNENINQSFYLKETACFGSPRFQNKSLHILLADSRFLVNGNHAMSRTADHFLAVFPLTTST